jgi:hypothetical protein
MPLPRLTAANAPALVASVSALGVFAGLWMNYGVGTALTVCCGVVFALVGWTHVRGGYG